jgi:serine phosphatase RsbU (regulator of sigma subunit)
VSGDFYWLSEVGSKVFLAAVDCTGHGVPGAFLSIIGMNLLRSIIEGQKEDNPAKILEKLSWELDKTFRNEEAEDRIKDGMDMAICVIDRDNASMQFAGAVNELYLIRNRELIVYKGDRNPVGHSVDGVVPNYTTNDIEIHENDMFYIFSDGYADQFGGPDFKKFKYRKFRYLLLNNHRLQPDEQKEALTQAFDGWKGNNEQVDDVLVMGFCPIKNDDF